MLAEAKAELETLRGGDYSGIPPWIAPTEALLYVEQEVERLQKMMSTESFWINGNEYRLVPEDTASILTWDVNGCAYVLASVNGGGDIRWVVNPNFVQYNEEHLAAAKHFGLVVTTT